MYFATTDKKLSKLIRDIVANNNEVSTDFIRNYWSDADAEAIKNIFAQTLKYCRESDTSALREKPTEWLDEETERLEKWIKEPRV